MPHTNDLSDVTASDAADAVKGKLSDVADTAREGVHRAERHASNLTDKAAQTMREAARHMRDIGSGDIADTLRDRARQVQSRANGVVDDMRDNVVEHPLMAVAIAAGVGALAAMVLKSRSS